MDNLRHYPSFYNKLKYLLIALTIYLALASQSLSAQQYFVKSYTAEDGLPTRIVTDVCQDKTGYMWFTTYSGVSKYDGFSFTNYDTIYGLPNQQFRKIVCDQEGVIWAVPYFTHGKLVTLKDNKWKSIQIPNLPKNATYITSFDVSYKGKEPVVCIGSYGGIDVFTNNSWKHYNVSDDKGSNIVYCVTEKSGSFYLATKLGLCILKGGSLNWMLNYNVDPGNEAIYSLKFEKPNTPDERMWILTNHSIGFYQKGELTILNDEFLLDDVDVANFAYLGIGKSDEIYFGNNFSKFILKINERKIIPLRVKNAFSSNGASSLFVDREGNVWITDSRGVDKINNISIVSYFESNGLPANEVTAIVEANDGRFILGHSNLISILDGEKFKTISFPGKQNNLTRVLDMMKDREGNIWISANMLGVGRLSPKDKLQWYPTEKGNRTTAICQDNTGKIWVGTNRKLFYFKGDKIVEYELNNKFTTGVRKIFPSADNGIYITTMTGLWYIDKNNLITRIPTAGNIELNVFTYYDDQKGNEFVGTMNGLYCVKNGIIIRYKNEHLQLDNPVFFILQDKDKFYWFGTNNGVYRWDGINDPDIFNTFNGLAGRETNRSAGLLDSKGRVWVGTDRGLSCFTLNSGQIKTPSPTIELLYTQTSNGDIFPLNSNCSLLYTDNTLFFHFRGISFINEGLLTYKYKLEGYDKVWREATQAMLDKISYSGLKPGTYRLNVQAKNYSSAWSEVACSSEIVIRPPYYLTWWFIASSITGFIILLVLFYLFFTARIVNKALKKEIEERKLVEQSLKESEQRLSFVLQGSHLGSWDWDMSTKTIRRNALCKEILGYKSDELEVHSEQWSDLIHPEDRVKVESSLQDHLNGKTTLVEVEYRMLSQKGQYQWMHDRYMIVQRNEDGKPQRLSGTLSDITQRKQSEEALQRSEERLRLLMASLPIAIYVSPINADIDIELIAGNVESLTGFSKEEYLSSSDFWRRRLHPLDKERVLIAFSQAVELGGITIEYQWMVADGSYKWFHDQSIINSSGENPQFMGVLVDISDLKKAGQEIKNKNEQLNLINAEKDKLFSIISHDLRSPVNGFLGLTNLLEEELENLSQLQIKEIATALNTSAIKVSDLLNDLLEWSLLQRGLTVLNPTSVAIAQIVGQCANTIAELAKAKNIEVVVNISDELLVTADIHALQVVLRNLLTNAVKFTAKSGRVTVSASDSNNSFVKISVTDTGIGINPELAGKLFKVNEKTSRKGTEGEPSSGLGLILCKEFVLKQKGEIGVESTEGKGSTFYFTLPSVGG
ncbi:MAG: PAS domain-containing protein [Bacteroidales bacterium]